MYKYYKPMNKCAGFPVKICDISILRYLFFVNIENVQFNKFNIKRFVCLLALFQFSKVLPIQNRR